MKEEDAALTIQKYYKGYLSRKNVLIQNLGRGVIHTRIRGDANLFAIIDIQVDEGRNSRAVDILSINPDEYKSKAVGGNEFLNPITCSNDDRVEAFGREKHNVFINGGFFNSSGSYKEYSKSTPIGPTRTEQCSSFIPTPDRYKDCFGKLNFDDDSYISSAPLLSVRGLMVFDGSKLSENRFNYDAVRQGKLQLRPGDLYHSSDPNPRAGIAFPGKTSMVIDKNRARQNRVRLVAVLASGRGEKSNGFTMPEFSSLMARLDRMNIFPGESYNLDGGGSVVMGITDHRGDIVFRVAQENERGRDSSTMIIYNFRGKVS